MFTVKAEIIILTLLILINF